MTSAFWSIDVGMTVTVHRHAAIFKAVEPLFNSSDPHCIIAKSLLNFVDFVLGYPQISAKTLCSVTASSVLSS
jgi:hypothetical protein